MYNDLMDASIEAVMAEQAIIKIRPFLPDYQFDALMETRHLPHTQQIATRLAATVENMPVTYETDGQGDSALIHLHYFSANGDWYITEKDMDGGVLQAFGKAALNGFEPEYGYINIQELVSLGVELDLYWEAKPVSAIV